MELPSDWGLRTEKRDDGKLDIIGKTDGGEDYRVRTTDGPEVTGGDLAELHDADRNSYRDRTTGARTFMDKLVSHGRRAEQNREEAYLNDLTAASNELIGAVKTNGRATRPGMIELPSTFGSSRKYRAGWPKDWEN